MWGESADIAREEEEELGEDEGGDAGKHEEYAGEENDGDEEQEGGWEDESEDEGENGGELKDAKDIDDEEGQAGDDCGAVE